MSATATVRFSEKVPNRLGVSENRDTPKWMVYNGKLIKMDDLGNHYFRKHPFSSIKNKKGLTLESIHGSTATLGACQT